MKISSIMIGIVFFALITSGFWFFATDLANDYSVTIDPQYMDEYNKMDTLRSDLYEPMRNKTQGANDIGDESTTGVKLSNGVYGAVKYAFAIPSIITGSVGSIAEAFGISSFWTGAFILICGIVIVFLLISAVFGRDI